MPTPKKGLRITAAMMEEELSRLIVEIVDLVRDQDLENEREIKTWESSPDSLTKLAALTERKIKRAEIGKIKKGIARIIKASSNKLIVATIQLGD